MRDETTVSISVPGGPSTGPIPMDQLRKGLDQLLKDPAMKETDADVQVRDKVYRVTADELRAFIERIERLNAEKAEIAERVTEVYAEAKGRGYDAKVMRKIVALRKRAPDDVAEEEAVMDMYRSALGM